MRTSARFARPPERSRARPITRPRRKPISKGSANGPPSGDPLLLRDLYSRNQLKEQLTWFWMNHFNVSQNKGDIRALVGDYEENAIRPHVLGKFRDLLAATVRHPAMLRYLDNAQNAAGHINENYAREIMELHTMGVGSRLHAEGRAGAGAHPDRRRRRSHRPTAEAAAAICASTIAAAGLFEFNPNRHDFGDKIFLGHADQGRRPRRGRRGDRHPGAPNRRPRIMSSTELAQYFCCDAPPDRWSQAWRRPSGNSDGDIAAVLQTMFAAPEFQASLGQKFKDPMHYAVSAVRAAYGDQVILNTQPLLNWLNRMGEALYNHETPDGYPMTAAAWTGPGEMETRFEIARQIGARPFRAVQVPDDPPTEEPAPPPLIQQTRYYQAMAPTLSPATLAALDQARSPADWNMLFLSSPEFMHR